MWLKIIGALIVGAAIALAFYGPGEEVPRRLDITIGDTERLVMVVALGIFGLFVLALSGRRISRTLAETPGGEIAPYDPLIAELAPRQRMSDRGRGPIVFGLVVCGAFFGTLVFWSALSKIESAAVAQATVRVENNRLTLDHPDGGTIAELLVREGEEVRAGQILMRLDATALSADLEVATRRQQSLQALQARLAAEQDGSTAIRYPAALVALRQRDPEVATLLDAQNTIFSASKKAFQNDIAVRRRSIAAFQEQIAGLQAQLTATQTQVEIINQELADLEKLFAKKLTPQSRVLAMRRERARLKGAAGSLRAQIAQSRTRIGQTEISIIQLQQERVATRSNQFRETFAEIMALLPKISAVRTKLSRTIMRAPADGEVFGLTKFTIGGVVKPGEAVLEIVPKQSELIVEAKINLVDRDVLRPGMPARVRFTAFGTRDVEPIEGQIARISGDAVQDDASNETYYKSVVKIGPELLVQHGITLQPGMPAEVIVPLTARTPLQYLLEPLIRNWERALREE